MTWFSGVCETNAPSHSKHAIIQGFLRGRHLRLSQMRRESESFNYHQSKIPKGRSQLLPFVLSSGVIRKIPNIRGGAFRPFAGQNAFFLSNSAMGSHTSSPSSHSAISPSNAVQVNRCMYSRHKRIFQPFIAHFSCKRGAHVSRRQQPSSNRYRPPRDPTNAYSPFAGFKSECSFP